MDVRIGAEPVGRWGAAVLIVAGVAGAALGAHGWASRHAGSVPHALGAQPRAANSTPARPARPTASSGPAGHARASAQPSGTGTATPGPLLRSMPFAQYSYQIYPGKLSAAAQQALTGLTVNIHSHGAEISITTAVNGGPTSSPQLFPAGDHVYVVESALGDDSSATDYNLGDDSLVVTDSNGRIVR